MHLAPLIAMETTASSAEYGQLFLPRVFFFSLSAETLNNGLFLFLWWEDKFLLPHPILSDVLLPVATAP